MRVNGICHSVHPTELTVSLKRKHLNNYNLKGGEYKKTSKKNTPQPHEPNPHFISKLVLELGALPPPRTVAICIHLIRERNLLVVERGEEADFFEHTC